MLSLSTSSIVVELVSYEPSADGDIARGKVGLCLELILLGEPEQREGVERVLIQDCYEDSHGRDAHHRGQCDSALDRYGTSAQQFVC